MFQAGAESKLVAFTAVEKFGPQNSKSWDKYIQWSKLSQLTEVVSLDGCLCANVLKDLIDEDWKHNVQEDFKTDLFWDLDYLLERVSKMTDLNILALVCEPATDAAKLFQDARFEFVGYDLVDQDISISALTNCGGFDLAFQPSELSYFGLLTDLVRAKEVKASLIEHYSMEHHAHCNIWAIWKMKK
jgi:hypothetical protein